MTSPDSRSPPPPSPASHVGGLLRAWRGVRRLSQLELALEAEVSSRHLSYVETGKAQPSRDLVSRLAAALDLPLRERNALLVAAGYAPLYRETPLATPEMTPLRRAIDSMLEQQEPYPGFVLDRHWNVLRTNEATMRVLGRLRPGGPRHANVVRQIFDPDDMRPAIANWEEVAGEVVRHLHDEVAAAPTDGAARALLDGALAYPGVPPRWHTREVGAVPAPVLTTEFRGGGLSLSFFSTLTTFGTPRDVVVDELRIECMYPADEATAELCRRLRESHSPARPRRGPAAGD